LADLAPGGHRLTPQLADQLIAAAKSGLFKEACARCVGVDEGDLDTWLRMGLSPGAVEPYRTFARVFVAQEEGQQLKYIDAWRQAAAVDWRAAAQWLATRYPDVWGPKASRNRPAASLASSEADAAAEEELVRQLIAARPAVLVRLIEEAGGTLPPITPATPAPPET